MPLRQKGGPLDSARCISSRPGRFRLRQLLHPLEEGEGLGMGKRLARQRDLLLDPHALVRRIPYRRRPPGHPLESAGPERDLVLSIRRPLGNRGIDLRPFDALPGHVPRLRHRARPLRGLRYPDSPDL